MPNDLTTSDIERQNILNNPYTVDEIAKAVSIETIEYRGKRILLKEQVAAFFEVTVRTSEKYLAGNAEELAQNGYEVLRGKSLKDLKLALSELDVTEVDFGNIGKAPQLGIFDFRAFLNIAMLIAESERKRLLLRAIALGPALAAY